MLPPAIGLTPGQETAIAALEAAIAVSERLFVLWYGGVRGGKTVGACKLLVGHSYNRAEQYIVGAYTQRQVWNIIAPKVKAECELRGIKYKAHRDPNNPRMDVGDNEFLVYGGKDSGQDRNVQGNTAAGLLLDEFVNLNEDFVKQCEARTSVKGAIRVYTANKPSPHHWTTEYYYNRALRGEIKALLLDTDTEDNQFLDRDYVEERISEYDDKTRDRFISNLFVLDKPPIYTPLVVPPIDSGNDIALVAILGADAYLMPIRHTDMGWLICDGTKYRLPFMPNEDAKMYLVPDNFPLLAKDLRRVGKKAKVYRTNPDDRRREIAQKLMGQRQVKVASDAKDLLRAIELFSNPLLSDGYLIPALDGACEYLHRTKRI